MWRVAVYFVLLVINSVVCIPVPHLNGNLSEVARSQDHQVDNVEIHHDVNADVKNQELANDLLPDHANDAAGDRQLGQDEQQIPVIVLPVAPDANAAHSFESKNDEKKMDLSFVKEIKALPVDKLVPANHLDVVKMEQDGHINKEYHKEMFLGEEHDEFKGQTIEDAETKLKEIVDKADIDKDGRLSKSEIEKWILIKMMEHFDEAKKENAVIFKHLDPDGDGFIKWKEYYAHFLLSRGVDAKNAWQHVVDYEDTVQLKQDDKDALISYKYKWTDADKDPTDNQLSEDEFLIFRHPEHDKRSLEMVANHMIKGIDIDGDGIIMVEEFAALPAGEVEGKEFIEMDRKWQEERRLEFAEILDENHDGMVDIKELKKYLDPTNPAQAKVEAASLISMMDDDKDKFLSMAEILNHADIFISSKIYNFADNVHDEF